MSDLQVMIVDSRPAMRQAIRLALIEDEGLSIVEAGSLDEAKSLFGIQCIDVVLAGRKLGESSWQDLAAELGRDAMRPCHRFIVVGKMDPIERLTARCTGVDAVIAKSCLTEGKSRQLVDAVEMVAH